MKRTITAYLTTVWRSGALFGATPDEAFGQLPVRLRELAALSMRLQDRIIHIDRMIYAGTVETVPSIAPSAIEQQIQRVRRAFEAGR